MLTQAVTDALAAQPRDPRDAATAQLALTYAQQIDDGEADITKAGPALLAALESLLLSPRARAAAKKAVTDAKPVANPIDELAGRRAGKGRAAAMDASTP